MNNYRGELHKSINGLPLVEISLLMLFTDPQGNIMMTRKPGSVYWKLPGGWMDPQMNIIECLQHRIWENFAILPEESSLLKVFSGKEQFYYSEDDAPICPVYMLFFPERIRGSLQSRPKNGAEIRFFAPWNIPMKKVFPPMINVIRYVIETISDGTTLRAIDLDRYRDLVA